MSAGQPVPVAAMKAIAEAGNTDDEGIRQHALDQLAGMSDLDERARADSARFAEFVRLWNTGGLKFYNAQFRGLPKKDQLTYDFGILPDSPIAPLTDLYLGRIIAWNLIEDSTVRSSPELARLYKDRSQAIFQRYVANYPDNAIAQMYLGRKISWPVELSSAGNAPKWATLQRENLHRLREIILWWVQKRQRSDGQFGGGWGDDCEMWRWWAPVLLGFDDAEIRNAQVRFSRTALNRIAKTRFNTDVTDVEHAAEDSTDNLVPLLVLEPEVPAWSEWSASLINPMRDIWTGRNLRGELQFRSFYFSNAAVATEPRRALDVLANVGALHPALLVWQRTGDAQLGKEILPWLDTWVAATERAENGKPAGVLPASIKWPSGEAAGVGERWWEPIAPGGFMYSYYVWPSVITEMTDAMVVAYTMTRNEKYLSPIRSMAELRLRHLKNGSPQGSSVGSESWCAEELRPRQNANSNTGGIVKTAARLKALLGTSEFDELLALEGVEFVVDPDPKKRGDLVRALQESVEALRVNFPGFTSEVRSTDRVMRFAQYFSRDYRLDDYLGVTIPKHELLYRMVTGDKNAPRFPQMAVRWLTPSADIAALVTKADLRSFEAELYHFGDAPRPVSAELKLLRPGSYRVQVAGADGRQLLKDRFRIEANASGLFRFSLPPRELCVVHVEPES